MFDTVHTAYPVIGLILYGTSKICTKLRDKFLSANLNSFDSILQRLSQKWNRNGSFQIFVEMTPKTNFSSQSIVTGFKLFVTVWS